MNSRWHRPNAPLRSRLRIHRWHGHAARRGNLRGRAVTVNHSEFTGKRTFNVTLKNHQAPPSRERRHGHHQRPAQADGCRPMHQGDRGSAELLVRVSTEGTYYPDRRVSSALARALGKQRMQPRGAPREKAPARCAMCRAPIAGGRSQDHSDLPGDASFEPVRGASRCAPRQPARAGLRVDQRPHPNGYELLTPVTLHAAVSRRMTFEWGSAQKSNARRQRDCVTARKRT